ncbi:hypothetical protein, partial [Lentzea sp. NPDC004782]|uniref:hypothetical protein n=1 Tax=Lentzea sp. NPDC004782 TaxID=3154458 RepID=UPI0033BC186D
TYRYLYLYMWQRVVRWLRARHPKLGWHKIKRRFLTGHPASRPVENGIVLYNPQDIVIERYRWRGYTIPAPWTSFANRLNTAAQA